MPFFLQRKRNCVLIQLLQRIQECSDARPIIISVGAENAGKALPAAKGNPGELPAVIIEESRCKADAPPGSYIGESRVVWTAFSAGGDPPPTIKVRPYRSSPVIRFFSARGSSRCAIR